MQSSWTTGSFSDGLISFSMAYFENIKLLKDYFKISGRIFDFTSINILKNTLGWVILLKLSIKINHTVEDLMIYILFYLGLLL